MFLLYIRKIHISGQKKGDILQAYIQGKSEQGIKEKKGSYIAIYIYRKYPYRENTVFLYIYRNTLWGNPKKKKCLFPIYKKKKHCFSYIGKFWANPNKKIRRYSIYIGKQ